jgi:hypothetical protein
MARLKSGKVLNSDGNFITLEETQRWLNNPSLNGQVLSSDTAGNRFWINPPAGAQGGPGAQGSTGSTGPQGLQGHQGQDGPQGFQGVSGISGTQGFQGVQGSQGAAGTSVIIIGSVPDVYVNPPNDPQITLNNAFPSAVAANAAIDQGLGELWVYDGATWNNVGQIVGPTGPQGPQGNQGYQGTQGSVGPQGNVGAQGLQGVQGSHRFPRYIWWNWISGKSG